MDPEMLKLMEETKGVAAALRQAHEQGAKELAETKTVSAELKGKLDLISKDLEVKFTAVETKMAKMETLAARGLSSSAKEEKLIEEAKDFSIIAGKAQGKTVNVEANEYKQYLSSMQKYAMFGERALTQDEYKTLQVGKDPAGGYLTMVQRDPMMVNKKFDSTSILNLVDTKITTSGDLEIVVDWADYDKGYYADEIKESADDEGGEDFKLVTIRSTQMLYPKRFSRTMIEDALINVESDILGKLREGIARKTAGYILTGTGTGQPKGILSYGEGTTYGTLQAIETESSGVVGWKDFLSVAGSLKDKYHPNAAALMRRESFFNLIKQVGSDGQFIVNVFERDGIPVSIAGYPIAFDAGMPSVAAGAKAVIFGDFREAYKFTKRVGLSIIRDDITNATTVKITARERNGGEVVNFDALKTLKVKA